VGGRKAGRAEALRLEGLCGRDLREALLRRLGGTRDKVVLEYFYSNSLV
jgi:hypothetical protein